MNWVRITVNEIPANLNKNSSDVMEPFIPEGMKVDTTTREVIGPDNRYRITDTTEIGRVSCRERV